jgi:hypothetical protein
MKHKTKFVVFLCSAAAAACLFASATASAQAPPGPIRGPQPAATAQPAAPPRAQTAPAHAPRQPHDLAGAWKLNHDESDDPQKKLEEEQQNRNAGNGGYGGRRGGIGYPGGGGGYGGRRGESDDDRQRMRQFFNPTENLTIAQKDPEVDFTDDLGVKQAYFTDGRKIEKSKDPKNPQAAAKWDGTRLVSEEKTSNGRKATRTYELSPDGDQLFETLKIANDRSQYPLSIRYVYDAVPQPRT